MSPTIGLALGGGGARGLAHIHVLLALDELGLTPVRIAGSSIGAILGAAYAAGMSGAEIRDHVLEAFARPRAVAGRLWRTRPPSVAAFRADGGFRLGQMNAERLLGVFLPASVAGPIEDLAIPLTVIATDFYARREVPIETGDLLSALAASAALPAVFRPVLREARVLVDGGIYNPLPFDQVCHRADVTVAVDVVGGPEDGSARMPTSIGAIAGASQLMMQSIIETRLRLRAPDVLLRPPVSSYGVLDFLRARTILEATAALREEAKAAIGAALDRRAAAPPIADHEPAAFGAPGRYAGGGAPVPA